jgi:hypothetical protein
MHRSPMGSPQGLGLVHEALLLSPPSLPSRPPVSPASTGLGQTLACAPALGREHVPIPAPAHLPVARLRGQPAGGLTRRICYVIVICQAAASRHRTPKRGSASSWVWPYVCRCACHVGESRRRNSHITSCNTMVLCHRIRASPRTERLEKAEGQGSAYMQADGAGGDLFWGSLANLSQQHGIV